MEGSKASRTSKETEIKLVGVARASLDELLNDYCDLLRVQDLRIWEKESRETRFVRRLGSEPDATYKYYRGFCEIRSLEVVANIAICLIHQTNYLFDPMRLLPAKRLGKPYAVCGIATDITQLKRAEAMQDRRARRKVMRADTQLAFSDEIESGLKWPCSGRTTTHWRSLMFTDLRWLFGQRISLASCRLPSTLAPCFSRTVSSIGRASDS